MLMATLKISSDLQNIIKKVVLDTYYPIGKIYITLGNENPNKTIGGTWIKFGASRCLVGVDTSLILVDIVWDFLYSIKIEDMMEISIQIIRVVVKLTITYNHISHAICGNEQPRKEV